MLRHHPVVETFPIRVFVESFVFQRRLIRFAGRTGTTDHQNRSGT
jgi:hypothetical protein